MSEQVSDIVATQTTGQSASSDADLVQLAVNGRPQAFDDLVRRHQKQAANVAYRFLGNAHDALEVTQDAFLKAFTSLSTLEQPERFRAWLLRIVTNLALNYRRGRAVGGPRVSLDDCLSDDDRPIRDELAAAPHQAGNHPETRSAAGELAEQLEAAISRLPEQQRLALVLFSVEHLPQKEVAAIMQCSVEAVKWHVFQARKKLRVELADYLMERE